VRREGWYRKRKKRKSLFFKRAREEFAWDVLIALVEQCALKTRSVKKETDEIRKNKEKTEG